MSFLGLSLGLSQGFIFSGFLPDGWKHPAYCSTGRWGGPQAAPASQVSHFPLAQSRLGPPICEGPSSPIIPKARPKQSSPVAQLSGINCQSVRFASASPVRFNLTLALGPQEPCPTSREFPPQLLPRKAPPASLMLLPVLIMPLFFVSDQTADPKGQRETHVVSLHSAFPRTEGVQGPVLGTATGWDLLSICPGGLPSCAPLKHPSAGILPSEHRRTGMLACLLAIPLPCCSLLAAQEGTVWASEPRAV